MFLTPCFGHAQTLLNGDLSEGSSGWDCSPSVVQQWLVGGPLTSNHIAVLSGGLLSWTTADDNGLCQTITGLVPGSDYVVSFQATRPGSASTATSSGRLRIVGAGIDQVVSRTGGFDLTWEFVPFTASATSHVLRFDPANQALVGLALDNFNVALDDPLPIELAGFSAISSGSTVELSWTTMSEWDNATFSLLRSHDQLDWTPIGAVSGSGFTSEPTAYGFSDPQVPPGLVHYRLLQTDLSGHSAEIGTCAVVVRSQQQVVIWPNPANGVVRFNDHDPSLPVRLQGPAGRSMPIQVHRANGTGTFDAAPLPPGTYQLVVGGELALFVRE